jgi:Tfp pilus assembly protein PilO
MKHKLILILAVLLLVGAVAANGVTRYYAKDIKTQRRVKEDTLRELLARTKQRDAETAKCNELKKLGAELKKALQWEQASSTKVNSWFSQMATELGAEVKVSGMIEARRGSQNAEPIMGGALERSQYDVRVTGDYLALVKYVERVEQSPMVMIVNRLNIRATPGEVGVGTLNMTITCLRKSDEIPEVALPPNSAPASGGGAHGKGGAS